MRSSLPKLHAVTNESIITEGGFPERLTRLAATGRVAVHLRGGAISGRRLTEAALEARAAIADTTSALFVNDRIDVARAVDAEGIHLPSHGVPVKLARRLKGSGQALGVSVHSVPEAFAKLKEGADYVFLGPIFETRSHPGRAPLGPEVLSQCAGAPVIAIGGINRERVAVCLEHGAYGIAAISALWLAEDPATEAHSMLLSLDIPHD